jgi:hypothetical protein
VINLNYQKKRNHLRVKKNQKTYINLSPLIGVNVFSKNIFIILSKILSLSKFSIYFNALFSEINESCYSNEDIDYMINMIRNHPKDFEKSNTISNTFTKTLNSIHQLCGELNLHKLEDRIYLHYSNRDIKTALKLMIRCKELFVLRVRGIRILQLINDREVNLD